MKNGKILIADDEKQITTGLSAILSDEGYEVDVADDGQRALDRLTTDSYGVVLADLKMPKIDGIALLKEMRARGLPTELIMITGQGSTELAIEAIRHGAADYIEKPLNTERLSKLKAQLPKLMDQYAVLRKNRELSARLENLTHFGELTGQSEVMREVYKIIEAVSPSTASVLILGESGTGQELVARAIHQKSERVRGPFFALNCAALPKEILENELFGHEKGAFTGRRTATCRRRSPTATCAKTCTTDSRSSISACRRSASGPTTCSCSRTSSWSASGRRTGSRLPVSRTRPGTGSSRTIGPETSAS